MSRSGEITLPFGVEERPFRLGVGEWRKVQERCDAGPGELLTRMSPLVRSIKSGLSFAQILAGGLLGSWRIDDIREVILQGLIGGGMSPTEAGMLVREEFDGRLTWEHAPLAYLIAEAGINPPRDEPLGETKAATPKTRARRRSQGASSASPQSTAPGP